jgi:hypothetical protein
MKRKSRNAQNNSVIHTRYSPFDLFGEIPVTWDEVYQWCEKVAEIPRDSWRLDWYIRGWNVPAKIRAAKQQQPLQDFLNRPN